MDVDKACTEGHTPLMEASRLGHANVVSALLQAGADPDVVHATDRVTALTLATVEGHAHVVSLLLNYGADVDAIDEGGDTALSEAAYHGHVAIAKKLLKAGADPDLLCCTPLAIAARYGQTDVVRLLAPCTTRINQRNCSSDTSALDWAVRREDLDCVDILLEHGADPKDCDMRGDTAFSHASTAFMAALEKRQKKRNRRKQSKLLKKQQQGDDCCSSQDCDDHGDVTSGASCGEKARNLCANSTPMTMKISAACVEESAEVRLDAAESANKISETSHADAWIDEIDD